MSELKCPSCGSHNVKLAELVISDGTYSGSATHRGIGLSSSGSVSIGVGSTAYQHQSQTAANIYAPDGRNYVKDLWRGAGIFVGVSAFIIIIVISGEFMWGLSVGGAFAATGEYIGKNSRAAKKEDERLAGEYLDFKKTFICQVCGDRFVRSEGELENQKKISVQADPDRLNFLMSSDQLSDDDEAEMLDLMDAQLESDTINSRVCDYELNVEKFKEFIMEDVTEAYNEFRLKSDLMPKFLIVDEFSFDPPSFKCSISRRRGGTSLYTLALSDVGIDHEAEGELDGKAIESIVDNLVLSLSPSLNDYRNKIN